jgi:uncharacterized protein YvpB
MSRRAKKIILKVTVLTLLLLGLVVYWQKDELVFLFKKRQSVPEAKTADQATATTQETAGLAPAVKTETAQSVDPPRAETVIPPTYNLKVPFTSQAPLAVWDKKDEEACEETALLMAHRYYTGHGIDSTADARNGIDQIIEWEKANLGGVWESTTAAELTQVAQGMLGYKQAHIIKDPSIDIIKGAISSGHPVLVPAAGRQLDNPFFKQPGPLYHMIVIKGYDDHEFITNDPGTRRGADYRYKFQTVLNANHDWNGGAVESGEKVIIVLK